MSRSPSDSKRVRRRRSQDDAATPVRRDLSGYSDQSHRVVYIAGEGEKTESDYVALLNREYGKREGFFLRFCKAGEGLRPDEVVDRVIAEASSPADEKWALFDRDSEDHRDVVIPKAMSRAREAGVQVGFSHPSFELWLLLHFRPFTSQEDGRSDAIKDLLRKHPKAKGFEEYDEHAGERGKGLAGQRGQSLVGTEKDAVRNARKLVGNCSHGGCSAKNANHDKIPGPRTETHDEWTQRSGHAAGCDPLKRDPSTDLWRLLTSLGIGKEEL
ncbi:RloB family protein [Streptomyces sp. G-G2]|uniref:RloB family protein n=1 Tax=Streptomyces sp. G-G2 TaxID=3046201 RepID=UPI0024BBE7DD|nr:RloB family protein [Streptomyces sp. G-G2]MDJ0379484.1 RloB family protein [Streptomyces sp. G-G2]